MGAELEDIPGVEFGQRELPSPRPRSSRRALLGGVGPVTAEQLEKKEKLEAGDVIGQCGLEASSKAARRRAGSPHRDPQRGGRAGPDPGRVERRAGWAARTTLELDVQAAAEEALDGEKGKAALVALEPASGDILAAANRPVDDTFDRALEGQYPPGSTFKVVTTAALLDGGLTPARPWTARRRSTSAASSSATSRAARRERCRSAWTSRSRATPPSSRSSTGSRPRT